MARAAGEVRWGLLGLGLAALVFGSSGHVLRDSARSEPFRVAVAPPLAVAASGVGLRWTGRVAPLELATRVVALVDGEVVGAAVDEDLVGVSLERVGPGHHLVELTLTQQGGRTQTVTDAVLVGPFAERQPVELPCALGLTIAAGAIERLVLPAVRERLLAAARATDLLGPETVLEQATVTLQDGSVRVRVALAGVNRVAIEAVLAAAPAGPRGLALTLEWLGPVEFTGALRTTAVTGGAAIGALVTGPLAPLGAIAGYVLADRYVARRARREVEAAVRGGLEQVSAVALLPERVELLRGEPRSAATVAFCGPLGVAAGVGISARFALRPVVDGVGDGPGPVEQGVVLPGAGGLGADDDVRVDVSIDAVNVIVDAWTRSGLLAGRIADAGWVARVDVQLREWTRLTLAGISVVRAPVVMPAGERWALSFSGLRLDLRGGDEAGVVLAAGRGFILPRFDVNTGVLELGGVVDRLRVTCVDETMLAPCFGALLGLGEVETRLNEALSPGTGRLPGLDVRGLLRGNTGAVKPGGLDVAALAVRVPEALPGVLRVTARLR